MTVDELPARPQVRWDAERDALLMEAIANGATMRSAAHAAGVNRDQAIGRFHRLRDRFGAQAA